MRTFRGHSSERIYIDICRSNQLKVLVEKTYRFVKEVWSMYMKRNMQVTGYVFVWPKYSNFDFIGTRWKRSVHQTMMKTVIMWTLMMSERSKITCLTQVQIPM